MHWFAQLFDRRLTTPPNTETGPLPGSAAAEAAVVRRVLGPGSGPYSGTPFRPVLGAIDADGQPVAEREPDEAEQHHRGIIDHSRHVSSLGRR